MAKYVSIYGNTCLVLEENKINEGLGDDKESLSIHRKAGSVFFNAILHGPFISGKYSDNIIIIFPSGEGEKQLIKDNLIIVPEATLLIQGPAWKEDIFFKCPKSIQPLIVLDYRVIAELETYGGDHQKGDNIYNFRLAWASIKDNTICIVFHGSTLNDNPNCCNFENITNNDGKDGEHMYFNELPREYIVNEYGLKSELSGDSSSESDEMQ